MQKASLKRLNESRTPISIISEKKKWFLKNNNLFYGRFSGKNEKFEIDTFPQMSSFTFSIEYDAVDSGQRYMWVDGNLYHW